MANKSLLVTLVLTLAILGTLFSSGSCGLFKGGKKGPPPPEEPYPIFPFSFQAHVRFTPYLPVQPNYPPPPPPPAYGGGGY